MAFSDHHRGGLVDRAESKQSARKLRSAPQIFRAFSVAWACLNAVFVIPAVCELTLACCCFYGLGRVAELPRGTPAVSGNLNQISATSRKLKDARFITGARPKASAMGAVINGSVMLITRPQLLIDAAVDRRWRG